MTETDLLTLTHKLKKAGYIPVHWVQAEKSFRALLRGKVTVPAKDTRAERLPHPRERDLAAQRNLAGRRYPGSSLLHCSPLLFLPASPFYEFGRLIGLDVPQILSRLEPDASPHLDWHGGGGQDVSAHAALTGPWLEDAESAYLDAIPFQKGQRHTVCHKVHHLDCTGLGDWKGVHEGIGGHSSPAPMKKF